MVGEVAAPLEGVVVLDLTRYLSGPFGTGILRDLGARVVKVEAPDGDPSRGAGPFDGDDSAYFHAINRGKESVVVDLRDADQVGRLRALLGRVDCVVENFRPGGASRFGLGPDEALAANPRLVYVSCSGFGAGGPYATRPAFDVIVQAMGGVMSVTGHPDGPPTRVGVSQADLVAGVFTALATLTGLLRRERTGLGAYLDVSMLEGQLALATHALGITALEGSPGRIGNRHPQRAPFDVFPTTDGYLALATVTDEQFRRLTEALDRTDLAADGRFAEASGRVEHVAALTAELARETRRWSTQQLEATLLDHDVPCGPVLELGEVLDDPQVAARGAVGRVERFGADGLPVPTLPFTLDGRRLFTGARAPDLGETGLDALERELADRETDEVER